MAFAAILFLVAASEDNVVDNTSVLMELHPDRLTRCRWESEVRLAARLLCSKVEPAQMAERGREMMTRVRTLEDSSGT